MGENLEIDGCMSVRTPMQESDERTRVLEGPAVATPALGRRRSFGPLP